MRPAIPKLDLRRRHVRQQVARRHRAPDPHHDPPPTMVQTNEKTGFVGFDGPLRAEYTIFTKAGHAPQGPRVLRAAAVLRGIEIRYFFVGKQGGAFRQRVHVALGHGEAVGLRGNRISDICSMASRLTKVSATNTD